MPRFHVFFLGALALAAGLLPFFFHASAGAAPGNDPGTVAAPSGPLRVGQRPPALSLNRLSGNEPVTLAGLAGNVVILDFWATFCGPCRQVMPALDSLYQRNRGRGLSVVGMSFEPESTINAFMQRRPVSYTVARDVGNTARRYGVRAIPTLVVLDRQGTVRQISVGFDPADTVRLERMVEGLLSQGGR